MQYQYFCYRQAIKPQSQFLHDLWGAAYTPRMKTVSFAEFDALVEDAQGHYGAYIQGILFDNDVLQIQLHGKNENKSLIIDVRSRVPFFIITSQQLPRLKKQIKPIVLFLRAHAMGLPLISIKRQKKYGRLIEFIFGSGEKQLTLEAHLFPQGKNIKATTPEASICLKKPQDLSEVSDVQVQIEKRSVDELYQEWMQQFEKPVAARHQESPKEAVIAKKRATLNKIKEHQQSFAENMWAEFAQWLHQERTEEVPHKYAHLWDAKKSIAENVEYAFTEAKKAKAKLESVASRIQLLEKEIASLEAGQTAVTARTTKTPESPLQGVKGRTREFSESIRAYIGKSGTDNLKLLRQSKAWYIWVHAKDWPSAHAIIAINKGEHVPPAVLKDVCLWVLRETVSEKQWQSWLGIKVDFLYTERRYLQPIKGDHHGRVRYTEAKTITLVVE